MSVVTPLIKESQDSWPAFYALQQHIKKEPFVRKQASPDAYWHTDPGLPSSQNCKKYYDRADELPVIGNCGVPRFGGSREKSKMT